MDLSFAWLVQLIFFILPAWLSNSSPVLLGGVWPIDRGRIAGDGRPIFGRGKTWLGFFAALSVGSLAAVLEAHFLPGTQFDIWNGSVRNYLLGGFLLSLGAMLGDFAGSFVKRRLGQKEGSSSFVLDQLTFLIVALALVLPLSPPMLSLEGIAVLVVLTYFAHRVANWWAHTAGLKKVPW